MFRGENDLYARLMAVKPDGLSQNAWAVRAGVNRMIFNDVKRRGNIRHDSLVKLLDAAGVTLADFEIAAATVKTEVRGTGMTPEAVREAWALPQAKAVPLLGTAFGSDLADVEGIETTELMLSEVLDYVARPPSLASDDEAYAVTVIGDSMAPRFEPGEVAFVSPRAPVHVGDDVLVQLRSPDDTAGAVGEDGRRDEYPINQAAGRITTVLLKRLVRRTSTLVELRQFNPDKTFEVPAARVRRIHKIRGRL